jgi:hypothetical protein
VKLENGKYYFPVKMNNKCHRMVDYKDEERGNVESVKHNMDVFEAMILIGYYSIYIQTRIHA